MKPSAPGQTPVRSPLSGNGRLKNSSAAQPNNTAAVALGTMLKSITMRKTSPIIGHTSQYGNESTRQASAREASLEYIWLPISHSVPRCAKKRRTEVLARVGSKAGPPSLGAEKVGLFVRGIRERSQAPDERERNRNCCTDKDAGECKPMLLKNLRRAISRGAKVVDFWPSVRNF